MELSAFGYSVSKSPINYKKFKNSLLEYLISIIQ